MCSIGFLQKTQRVGKNTKHQLILKQCILQFNGNAIPSYYKKKKNYEKCIGDQVFQLKKKILVQGYLAKESRCIEWWRPARRTTTLLG